ncbi:MAG: type II CRISPR-associated endonuclease Cas1 [Lachnospiraceae bacterium]|nr:type II CRISPR-associated endonuclease Cas1 [Lachnospiraceae bacterium]
MSWRTVVISNSAKLDYQLGYLVVRREELLKIHLDEIGILIIESTAVSLTAALLCELNKRKVKIVFCDEKRNPYGELIPYYGAHDTSAKIRRQIAWSEEIKGAVWTEIVAEKIRKQESVLRRTDHSEADMLATYIQELQFCDCTNREGHAAKVYFNALFGKDFTRTAENSINAALNYGYGVLLSLVNREVTANGYMTQLGLFHDNTYNPFNLSSDLMEPFRPIIDEFVYRWSPNQFESKDKHKMLGLLEKELWVSERKEILPNAVKIYVRSVFDALNDGEIEHIKFYQDEL